MKGISTWLFSKMVMLIFVTLVFGSMLSILNMIKERSYSDSAEVLASNIRDALQGVANTGSLSAQRVVPLPRVIPENTPGVQGREYTVVMDYDDDQSAFSIAIAWNSYTDIKKIKGFTASSLLYTPKITLREPVDDLVVDSGSYRFIVVNKTTIATGPEIYIGACKSAGITSPTECIPPDLKT
jgi:hypothetical protein